MSHFDEIQHPIDDHLSCLCHGSCEGFISYCSLKAVTAMLLEVQAKLEARESMELSITEAHVELVKITLGTHECTTPTPYKSNIVTCN
jgi:hypothetical protein